MKIAIAYHSILLLAVAWFFLVFKGDAWADWSWKSDDQCLAASIPDAFEIVKNKLPSEVESLLLIKMKGGDFPSFNVVRQAGEYPLVDKTENQIGNDIIDSYRMVGLLNAKLILCKKIVKEGYQVALAYVEYLLEGEEFQAKVMLVPSAEKHYVVTLINRKKNVGKHAALSENLFDGLHISCGVSDVPKEENSASAGLTNGQIVILACLLMSTLLVAILWLFRRRR